jgi:lipoprotein signal peptidase
VVDSLLLRGKLAFNLADTAAVCGTAVVLGSLFVPRAALL